MCTAYNRVGKCNVCLSRGEFKLIVAQREDMEEDVKTCQEKIIFII